MINFELYFYIIIIYYKLNIANQFYYKQFNKKIFLYFILYYNIIYYKIKKFIKTNKSKILGIKS